MSDRKRIFAVCKSTPWPLNGTDLFEIIALKVSLAETFRTIVHSQVQIAVSKKNNWSQNTLYHDKYGRSLAETLSYSGFTSR